MPFQNDFTKNIRMKILICEAKVWIIGLKWSKKDYRSIFRNVLVQHFSSKVHLILNWTFGGLRVHSNENSDLLSKNLK